MPRVIYNRVAKAGSTAMSVLIAALSKVNHFEIHNDGRYFITASQLNKTLTGLPDNSLYINHCNYLPGLPKNDYLWINMVREPVELEESYYYYRVSPLRGRFGEQVREAQKEDLCGCSNMEFDDCYRSYLFNSQCEHRMRFNHSAIKYFRDVTGDQWENQGNGAFSGPMAVRRVADDYTFVGIVDEQELSVMALEKLLPTFFRNATAVYRSLNLDKAPTFKTPETNPFTHTEKNGAVTTFVRDALKRYNPDDVMFYENVKRMFWWRITGLFPDLITTHGFSLQDT
jgi:heparan sulfate 2-O-sulfotransferase HS2ST1